MFPFFPSGPSDKASKLAQLVEKNLESYYKTDEKSQIKVESELKCLLIFFCKSGGEPPFRICFDNRFYKTYLLIKATSCNFIGFFDYEGSAEVVTDTVNLYVSKYNLCDQTNCT